MAVRTFKCLLVRWLVVCIWLACEQAHLRVTRASDEEQSDPAGRSLVKSSRFRRSISILVSAPTWACSQANAKWEKARSLQKICRPFAACFQIVSKNKTFNFIRPQFETILSFLHLGNNYFKVTLFTELSGISLQIRNWQSSKAGSTLLYICFYRIDTYV